MPIISAKLRERCQDHPFLEMLVRNVSRTIGKNIYNKKSVPDTASLSKATAGKISIRSKHSISNESPR
jgi:hypothetical protein